ncbi:CYP17A [Mytilus edulis]|uniref:CYP17A n=1 Tax=Mytilus edulis TaxID=6550 RepID=A0A8S3V3N5_MYTED|nr:CYP17A [Mytilus edulis]
MKTLELIFGTTLKESLGPSSFETLQSTSEVIDYHVNALELIFGTTLSNSREKVYPKGEQNIIQDKIQGEKNPVGGKLSHGRENMPEDKIYATVLIGLLVLLVVYKLRQGLKYTLPPGPFCWPLIGSYEVIQAKFLHEIFVKYAKKYGPVFTVSLGPYQMVVLNDINSVTEALVKSKADFANRPSIHSVHMFTEESKDIAFANYTPTWKLHRKIAGKALRQYLAGNRLEDVLHASMKKCLPLMAKENGPFNPAKYIDLMVYNIMTAVCFGESVELDDPDFMRFMKLRREANEMIGKGFVEDMFPIMYKTWTTKKYRTFSKTMNELITIIKRKFQEHEKTFDIGMYIRTDMTLTKN